MADDTHTENDPNAGRIGRRRLLRASGVALTVGLAGCSGAGDGNDGGAPTSEAVTRQAITSAGTTRSRTRSRTRTRTERSATEPAPTGTRTATETETATRTVTAMAREETVWLLDFTYTQSSREMQATVYNPTDEELLYDLRFFCLNADGYVIYYATVEGEYYTEAGTESDYSATVPAYVTDDVEYYSMAWRSDDYTDYVNLHRYPSQPPKPPSPFHNELVANPGRYASAEVASFTENDYGTAELITRVQNTHDETMLVQPQVSLTSSGGVTLASGTGQIFPLQPQQTARCVAEVFTSGYDISEVASTNVTIDDVLVMRMPPTTDIFEEVGRDTISGSLQVELRNTADVPVGAYGVLRWLRGDDLVDVVVATSDDVDVGERFMLDFGSDLRQGDAAYRATDYKLVLLTNDTLIGSYQNTDGDSYVGFTAPFGDGYGTYGFYNPVGMVDGVWRWLW